jgi:hypothetical protein
MHTLKILLTFKFAGTGGSGATVFAAGGKAGTEAYYKNCQQDNGC